MAAESAALNARASSKRSSGDIASALAITPSMGPGTSCRYSRSRGAVFEMRSVSSSLGVSPTNGGTPAIASYSTQASE